MLANPPPKRNVFLLGTRVTKSAIRPIPQELPTNRIALLEQMLNLLIVTWTQPAIRVTIEDGFAANIGAILCRGVPDPPVKDNSPPTWDKHGFRT